MNNHIKHLMNTISATFVYAGIDLENTGLLTEGKSKESENFSQTGHRFKHFPMKAFGYTTPNEIEIFQKVVSYFEKNFLLLNHKSITAPVMQYIHARTGGYMGPLCTLMREAAYIAIRSGEECITIRILESIRLDFDSEKNFRHYKKQTQAGAGGA